MKYIVRILFPCCDDGLRSGRIMLLFRHIILLLYLAVLLSSTTLAFAPSVKPDWTEAERTVRKFPPKPSPDLSAEQVAVACLRSLQLVDHPKCNAGLKRIHPFLTWHCIDGVTARGVHTVEEFCERGALSPVLQTFMGATRINVGEGTLSKGTSTRGDIISFPVKVIRAPVSAFQHKSGMIRDRVASAPASHDGMVVRLERALRPPDTGCWLIREITNSQFAEGGQGWSRDEGV